MLILHGASEPITRNHELAGKMVRPFRLRLYTVKRHLTTGLLLHIRFLVGSKKERTDIITGCLDASFELMLKPLPMNNSKDPIIH